MTDLSAADADCCDRCGDLDSNCQRGVDGEKICPSCIRDEAEKARAEQKEEEQRRGVYRERGRWYAR